MSPKLDILADQVDSEVHELWTPLHSTSHLCVLFCSAKTRGMPRHLGFNNGRGPQAKQLVCKVRVRGPLFVSIYFSLVGVLSAELCCIIPLAIEVES